MMSSDDDALTHGYASPPCFAHELDPLAVDPQQALDVARWRKSERLRLLSERAALSVPARRAASEVIAGYLDRFLADRLGCITGMAISAWWPIKAELDIRHWLKRLPGQGARAVLPVVVQRAQPLQFRTWTPDTRMERGFWNIPVPAEGAVVVPDVTLVPLVGWDRAGFRLGYGGGYFDRTLAAISPRPLAIGIGLDSAQVTTIFPQPHDIAMDAVITETGLQRPDR